MCVGGCVGGCVSGCVGVGEIINLVYPLISGMINSATGGQGLRGVITVKERVMVKILSE